MLGDAIDWALPILRAEAEERMERSSRCTVWRKSGRGGQDETTGLRSPTWRALYTDLICRLDVGGNNEGGTRTIRIDNVEYESAVGIIHLPIGTTDLADGDYVEITDGEWPGTVVSIVKAIVADQKTARRLPITEASRPTEWGS